MANERRLSAAEEAELKKLHEEEEAKKEALAAAKQQSQVAAAAAAVPVYQPAKAPPPVLVGDIAVTCLQTEAFCKLGKRKYNLQKGQEIMMDPSHAMELSQGEKPFVAPVQVIRQR